MWKSGSTLMQTDLWSSFNVAETRKAPITRLECVSGTILGLRVVPDVNKTSATSPRRAGPRRPAKNGKGVEASRRKKPGFEASLSVNVSTGIPSFSASLRATPPPPTTTAAAAGRSARAKAHSVGVKVGDRGATVQCGHKAMSRTANPHVLGSATATRASKGRSGGVNVEAKWTISLYSSCRSTSAPSTPRSTATKAAVSPQCAVNTSSAVAQGASPAGGVAIERTGPRRGRESIII
mmetsp:Transcript_29514/g.101754  ORF Transcript_29514/g.101754 Transcript_29514/m.101754 type:complete len:237 (-) Transcript_29514:30-740(-)